MTDWVPMPWPVRLSTNLLEGSVQDAGWIPVEALGEATPLTLAPPEDARWQRFQLTSRAPTNKSDERE